MKTLEWLTRRGLTLWRIFDSSGVGWGFRSLGRIPGILEMPPTRVRRKYIPQLPLIGTEPAKESSDCVGCLDKLVRRN